MAFGPYDGVDRPALMIQVTRRMKMLRNQGNAKENLAKLPEKCFGILPMSGEIIGLIAGESGYRPQYEGFTELSIEREGVKTAEEACNALNANCFNVTLPQRKAMEHGTMFGWNTPAADPDMYLPDGKRNREREKFYGIGE